MEGRGYLRVSADGISEGAAAASEEPRDGGPRRAGAEAGAHPHPDPGPAQRDHQPRRHPRAQVHREEVCFQARVSQIRVRNAS